VKTWAIIGGGPSLRREDVELLRGRVSTIAINDAYKLAPWADILYACDAKWWDWHQGVPAFGGKKYGFECKDAPIRWPDVLILRDAGVYGLGKDDGVCRGFNSGYQALNLAINLGATRVLLLGYDMSLGEGGRSHWFGDHPDRAESPFHLMIEAFDSLPMLLIERGIEVVNCSRRTALKAFPVVPIEDALAIEERAGFLQ
jgi:hypothetical protein